MVMTPSRTRSITLHMNKRIMQQLPEFRLAILISVVIEDSMGQSTKN